MHVLGASMACFQLLLLLLLGVLGRRTDSHLHGTRNIPAHFSRAPTYMMHLYRNFKTNQTRPLDYMDPEQADTIQSILSKSKSSFMFARFLGKVGFGEVKVSLLLAVKPQRQTPSIHISSEAE